MNFTNYRDHMEPVIPPVTHTQEYNSPMDRSKIFWVTTLITITISLIFVFGYWFGEKKSAQVEFAPTDSVDLSGSFNPDKPQINLPNNMNQNSVNNMNQNNSQAPDTLPPSSFVPNVPPSYLDQPLSKKGDSVTDQELSILDGATFGGNSNMGGISPSLPDIQTLPETPIPRSATNEMNIQEKKASIKTSPYYYTIQVATLQSEDGALRLQKQLKSRGYASTTVLKKGVLYRVRFGKYNSYGEAQKVGPDLKRKARVQDILILKIKR